MRVGMACLTPFEQVLGARFHHLMPQLRQLHGARAPSWAGQVTVTGAPTWAGRLVARFAGFPAEMQKAPFTLAIKAGAKEGTETWQRSFDGHELTSQIWIDEKTGQMREKIGAVMVELVPVVKVDALHIDVEAAWLLGSLRLPASLTPQSHVVIWQDEAGRYRFDIGAQIPMIGHLIRYEGWLRPAEASRFV